MLETVCRFARMYDTICRFTLKIQPNSVECHNRCFCVSVSKSSLFLSPLISSLFLAAVPCWKRSWLIIQGSTEAEIMMNFIFRAREWESERKRERGAEGNVLSRWNGVWLVKGFWVRLWQINCHLLLSHFPGMSEPIMALLSRGEIKRPITASDLLSLLSNIPTQGGEPRLW